MSVDKVQEQLAGDTLPLAERRNMVYAGTAVTYGKGRALIVATGMQTELGRITGLLKGVKASKTPLQENLDRVGRALAAAALAVVSLIVVLGLLRGASLMEMFMFGIAPAVAVVPEAPLGPCRPTNRVLDCCWSPSRRVFRWRDVQLSDQPVRCASQRTGGHQRWARGT